MFDYDVIVVGAGPAGSTAAYQLNKYGFDVLILDKKRFPRSKLCAGLLTCKTIKLLKRVFDIDLLDLKEGNIIDYSSNYYRIFYKKKLVYEQQMDTDFNYVYRSIYDNYLLQQVKKAGVEVREGVKLSKIDLDTNKVVTQKGEELSSNYIIAADGANSIIRRELLKRKGDEAKENFSKDMAMTIEGIISRQDTSLNLDYPVIHYGIINWGYGWVFPKKDALVIGIIGLKNKNGNFDDIYKDYLEMLNVNIEKVKYTGWPLPYGNFINDPIFKKTMLVGDAAGFVEPVTGEGIYYAQRSGEIAAVAIKESESNQKIDFQQYYQQLLLVNILGRLRQFKKARSFLCKKPLFLQKILFKYGIRCLGEYLTDIIQG